MSICCQVIFVQLFSHLIANPFEIFPSLLRGIRTKQMIYVLSMEVKDL
jgi:hypothetical protein